MEFILHTNATGSIAELQSNIALTDVQDFLDMMANANYQGTNKMVIHQHQLPIGFFELKTKIAGEILQKFSTYNQRLAIVGDFSEIESKSLRDFIRESNRIGRILFVASLDEALLRIQ
ncbi:DUF4180 domain-containing protein [Maribellus sediminis]|uniref:DUF4180 domain-containing protein n=1 Tax=Maribellus sediminis TaxID=2696285 RepID=UPI001430BB97|nr:DUF4180 domain-containing protein [Maribellus sediminis]